MSTIQQQKKTIGTGKREVIPSMSSQARQTLALGEQRGWDFKVLGKAPLPQTPVHLENWLIVPATQDRSHIPPKTFQRIQSLYANGIRPIGFVVVHEAPRMLSTPQKTAGPKASQAAPIPERIAGTKPVTFESVISSLAAGLSPLAMIFGAIFMGLIMIDPILVVVTEEGEWIEIDRWNTQA
jgi:hypothetical protein